jgi:hypothetical protein
MKNICGYISHVLMAAFIGLLLISGGCNAAKGQGFAIYLTRDSVPPSQMQTLNYVNLAEQPFLTTKDIVHYYSQTYALELTDSAFERVSNLEVPTPGKSFVATVNGKPVYWGAFWTPISSQSFDGVTIMKPLIFTEPGFINFELGYPAPSFYSGGDPRNNTEILNSLEQDGKLIQELNLSTIRRLPSPAKGYELYSWLQQGQWHFTLITGTNRGKTLDEIVSGENSLSESGLVKISVIGVEAIKNVLSKIPIETWLFWANETQNCSEQTGIKIQLPPIEIRNAIRDFALQSRLDFHVLE